MYQTSINTQNVKQATIAYVSPSAVEAPMEVDQSMEATTAERGTKRSADDEPPSDSHKKARVGALIHLLSQPSP